MRIVELSENAKAYIYDQISEKLEKCILIDIIQGGCSGMQYKFSYINEDQIEKSDEVIQEDGFKLIIKQKALLFIIGTVLEYEKTPTGAKLVFLNPNEKSRCGCGKSFNI
jgi:iron-sulfur cluster assembly protein